MRIFGRPLQTAMSYLCALCQTLPLSFVDADDDYDDDYSNRKIVIWLLCYTICTQHDIDTCPLVQLA